MAGPPRKRQRRDEYRKAQQEAAAQLASQSNNTNIDTNILDTPNGKQNTKPLGLEMPKKKFYRQRAHANPFSDHALVYPASPDAMDWAAHYPAFVVRDNVAAGSMNVDAKSMTRVTKQVEIADIGCGFGGLIVALSPLFPETLMIGMELRAQVTDYVVSRIAALRSQKPLPPFYQPPPTTPSSLTTATPLPTTTTTQPYHPPSPLPTSPPPNHNISALRTNTMKFLPNYFPHASLTHLFICFPDPHFKTRKHKARIVSAQLCAEYAYVVRPGGKVYTITDVEELHLWMVGHFMGRRVKVRGGDVDEEGEGEAEKEGEKMGGGVEELWEKVGNEENSRDVCVRVMSEETEEGKKVMRNGGKKYVAVFRRIGDPDWPESD